jgi:Putative beta barrel porin-7 (BBP7)
MRKGILWSSVVLLTTASMALAQEPVVQYDYVDAGTGNQFWFGGEYLLWWLNKSPEPVPLLVAVPPADLKLTGPATSALNQPGTQVVLGGSAFPTEAQSGARFTIGSWLDADRVFGVEGNYLFLDRRTTSQTVTSPGPPYGPSLTTPFLSISAPPKLSAGVFESQDTIAFMGSTGTATLSSTSSLQGAELNGLINLAGADQLQLALLGGFRWVNLHESLDRGSSQVRDTDLVKFPPLGEFVTTLDQFDTRNDFYGGQVGARLSYEGARFSVSATAKVALGDVNEVVNIKGESILNVTGLNGPAAGMKLVPVTTLPGGVFAQPTNIGHYSRNRFAVAPEATFRLGYNLTEWAQLFVGYDFLYIDHVARPGDQIDRGINQTQLLALTGLPAPALVGPARPAFAFQDSSFWAQGISFGLAFRF